MTYLDSETWKSYFDESARDIEKGIAMDVVRKAYQPLTSLQIVPPPAVKQTPKEMFATILSAYTTADAAMIWEDMVHAGLITDQILGDLLAKICSHEAINEAMEISWDDICTDTGCHPLDITHGKNKHLVFRPNHWANQIAKRLFMRALKLLK